MNGVKEVYKPYKTVILKVIITKIIKYKKGQKLRKKIWNDAQIKEYIGLYGFKLIKSERINYNLIIHMEDELGYKYHSFFDSFKRDHKSRFVHRTNPNSINNIKLWLKLNNKQFILLSDIYVNKNDKLLFKCLKENCEGIFQASWDMIYHGSNCSCCAGKQACLSNCLATKRPDLALEWHPTLNNELTPYDVTCGNMNLVWWQCINNPNHIWKAIINTRNSNNTKCPFCSQSETEKEIEKILEKYNINFIIQFIIPECKLKRPLDFDFAIFEDKEKTILKCLIEYDGIQHYREVSFTNNKIKSMENFLKTQKHDGIKNNYCANNKIPLLRIPYWEKDNIKDIIDNFLLKLDIQEAI
ncbi:MAG TPA: hypothetical protein DEG71_05735 [Clostridiales bacterium]|nr:hypothetical protein [Clostridiales bacterium]